MGRHPTTLNNCGRWNPLSGFAEADVGIPAGRGGFSSRDGRRHDARHVLATSALKKLSNLILDQAGQTNTSEPFLAPGARFDSLSPRTR
jgi:hypothetical protein